jgi:hypothetical protein
MSLRHKLLIALLIALILFAMSDLSGISEICAYYGGNLPECKN